MSAEKTKKVWVRNTARCSIRASVDLGDAIKPDLGPPIDDRARFYRVETPHPSLEGVFGRFMTEPIHEACMYQMYQISWVALGGRSRMHDRW